MNCRFEHLEYKLYEFGALDTREKLDKPDDMKTYGMNNAADEFLRSSIRQSMKNASDDDDDDDWTIVQVVIACFAVCEPLFFFLLISHYFLP